MKRITTTQRVTTSLSRSLWRCYHGSSASRIPARALEQGTEATATTTTTKRVVTKEYAPGWSDPMTVTSVLRCRLGGQRRKLGSKAACLSLATTARPMSTIMGRNDGGDSSVQVAIVGGGPTGLLLSCYLSRFGISHVLMEAKTVKESFQHPQAHFINTRSMEILRTDHFHLYQRVLESMPPVSEYEKFCFGYSLSDSNPLATVVHPVRYPLQAEQDANGTLSDFTKTPDPTSLQQNSLSPCQVGHLAQHKFAKILYDGALEESSLRSHGRLLFGTRVLNVNPIENGKIQVTAVGDSGSEAWYADVCIAADGANSTLREAEQQGNFSEQHLMNIHVKLSQEQFNSIPNRCMLYTTLNEHVVSMVVGHGDGEYVLQVPFFPPYQDPEVDFAPGAVQSLVSAVFGFTVNPTQIMSSRPWTMKSWIASRYHNRNGLVWVGDAAHAFPPAGGFGMNTGLQDAHNLAWKLCALFREKERGDPHNFSQIRNGYFDSYERERRPVAIHNAALSVRNYNRVLKVMNQCYLNQKHPEFLKKTLDAAAIVPFSTRQDVFRTLLRTALQPLALLGGHKDANETQTNPYRQHLKNNLQKLLHSGGGLPLLFPRNELGFSYAKDTEEKTSHGAERQNKSDTWADSSLGEIIAGRRIPHAAIHSSKDGTTDWSTIDLVSPRTFNNIGESEDNDPFWVVLVTAGEGIFSTSAFPFWEGIRQAIESTQPLHTKIVYLSPSGSLPNTDTQEHHHHFILQADDVQSFNEQGAGLVRPDGHVSVWVDGSISDIENVVHEKLLATTIEETPNGCYDGSSASRIIPATSTHFTMPSGGVCTFHQQPQTMGKNLPLHVSPLSSSLSHNRLFSNGARPPTPPPKDESMRKQSPQKAPTVPGNESRSPSNADGTTTIVKTAGGQENDPLSMLKQNEEPLSAAAAATESIVVPTTSTAAEQLEHETEATATDQPSTISDPTRTLGTNHGPTNLSTPSMPNAKTTIDDTPNHFSNWRTKLEETWAEAAGVREISELKQAVDDLAVAVEQETSNVQQLQQQVHQHRTQAEQLTARHKQMMLLHKDSAVEMTADDIQASLTAQETQARSVHQQSHQALEQAQHKLQHLQAQYMSVLRKRYQEEQVWQDKWRVVGTYWTWLLIGLNSVVFVAGQLLHYRREDRRMKSLQQMIVDQHNQQQQMLLEQTTKAKTEIPDEKKEETEIVNTTTKSQNVASTGGEAVEHSTDQSHHTVSKSQTSQNDKPDPSDTVSPNLEHWWNQRVVPWWLGLLEENEKENENKLRKFARTTAAAANNLYQQSKTSSIAADASAVVDQVHWPSMVAGAVAMWLVTNVVFPPRGGPSGGR